ncbi:MAG: LysR family transcriptional regulator [Pseudomonadota bacterium]|nr:LysR family transcriptional regulator [Pseudomonadota bacterium]
MDQIETLKAFVAVAQEGGFTQAANKLGLSNQLVSKYVNRLEEQLGGRLFNRTTRKVHLTEAGEQCLQYAKHILDTVNEMQGFVGHQNQEAQGILRISAPTSFATMHLSTLIGDFKKMHPKVGINLQLNDRKVDLLDEGYDLALRIGHLKSSSLVAKKIAPIRRVICASADYLSKKGEPQHPDELIPEDYLKYSYMEYPQINSPLLNALRLIAQKQQSMIEANNGELLRDAAIDGEGYVLQPTFIVGDALKQGKLIHILKDYEPEPAGLYVVYPHRQLMPSKLRVFLDFVQDYYGDVPYWDEFA